MGKFVLAYTGGEMAATPEEQEKTMAAWMGWFGELGAAVADPGNPFGASASVSGGSSGLTGYSILTADSLDAATTLAKGCPVLGSGGNVEVYEALEM